MTAREARWWHQGDDGRAVCTLCPRGCRLREGQSGFCSVRQNRGGRLVSLAYGTSTGFAVDPIEKKPLCHFLPGSPILSFGTAGCNLGCKFCQNWTTSKASASRASVLSATAEQVVELAVRHECASIACTYNEPIIYAEWMDDIGRSARAAGLRTVAVTNGYVTEAAREEVFAHVDAANVDLKGFTDAFYRKLTLSEMAPVLDFLGWLRHRTGIWLEVTTLVIPGWNDDPDDLKRQFAWMAGELGVDVPLHLTAFHPDFKLRDWPRTPPSTLRRSRELAQEAGLQFVYTGNVHDTEGQATRCPGCQTRVIERDWHSILAYRLVRTDRCASCGQQIPGVFTPDHPFDDGAASRYHGGRRDHLPFSKRIFRKTDDE